MPKSTHQHQEDSLNTDKKFRPEDEHIYKRDKQEFQASEAEKKTNESDQNEPPFVEKKKET